MVTIVKNYPRRCFLKELKVINKQGKLNQHKETLDTPGFMKAKI